MADDRSAPDTVAPPLPDNMPLIAKIPGDCPNDSVAATHRKGRKSSTMMREGGKPARKTIVIDSTTPGCFDSQSANCLGRYKESLNFLDVAESCLGDPFAAEIWRCAGKFPCPGMIDGTILLCSSLAAKLRQPNASDGLGRLRSAKPQRLHASESVAMIVLGVETSCDDTAARLSATVADTRQPGFVPG
jgi:hypothetical protein